MSGEGVKCRAYRYVKACERRRRIGRHLCKTCQFNENARRDGPDERI
jgi:hypothetical protein